MVAHGNGPMKRGIAVEFVSEVHIRLERQQKAGGIGSVKTGRGEKMKYRPQLSGFSASKSPNPRYTEPDVKKLRLRECTYAKTR